jgi:molybdate transport system ATP-binding protein
VRRQPRESGQRVRVQVAASDVSLSLVPEPLTTIMNQFRVKVLEVQDASPGEVMVRMSCGPDAPALLARITRRSAERLGIAPGIDVYARVKSVALLE